MKEALDRDVNKRFAVAEALQANGVATGKDWTASTRDTPAAGIKTPPPRQ